MSSVNNTKLTANIKAHGCAAKLSPAELAQIVKSLQQFSSEKLICGTENFEDAAVYKLSEDQAIITTIDFFPPLLDDPYLYGRIAAVNALSDVYAMGGRPLLALNVFCFPTCDYPLSVAEQIIAGGASAIAESGCLLVGGHSIQSSEPIYGLSVIGLVHPDKVLTNEGAKAGDSIVLCKAIGSGIALLAHKGALLEEASYQTLIKSLCRLNGDCLKTALSYDLHAATDITGFGLLGHLHEMSKASGLLARLNCKDIPVLPQVIESARLGLVPAAAYANRNSYSQISRVSEDLDLSYSDLLFDPQTSGGLLFALESEAARDLVNKLKAEGWDAAIIGSFVSPEKPEEAGIVEVS